MESLIYFQEDINARIAKAYNNVKKASKDRKTKAYLENKLESLDQLWLEFMTGHKKIMCTCDLKQLKGLDYTKDDFYDKTEEIYSEYKCYLKDSLDAFASIQPGSSSQLSTSKNKVVSNIRLPEIHIPTFSGNYSDWSTFRDLFVSLIHQNNSIDNVQKLHYLKGYLAGEAEQVLRHIPIIDTNYERCWKLLEDRYNNKKYICHQVLKRLLSQRNLTNESACGLKDLIDTTNDCLSTLSSIGVNITSWDILVIHILTLKLDSETKRQWEFNVSTNTESDELPTFAQFQAFVTSRYRAIEFLESKPVGNSAMNKNTKGVTITQTHKAKSMHVSTFQCPFCTEAHRLGVCKKFASETCEIRRDFVHKNRLCFNCLGSNHCVKECRTTATCRICKRKHHSLLHPKDDKVAGEQGTNKGSTSKEVLATSGDASKNREGSATSITCFSAGMVYDQGVLPTALVTASSKNGICQTVRALLDNGSQSSFITEAAVQYLRLKRSPVKGIISRVGDEQDFLSDAVVEIEIGSRVDPNFNIMVKAFVLKNITGLLPSSRIINTEWIEFKGLQLADPEFHTPNRVDLLLGAGFCSKILQAGIKRNQAGTLVAQSTSLGWVVSGEVTNTAVHRSENIKVFHCKCDANEILKKFWEIEADEEMNKEKLFTEEERMCEEHFASTVKRDTDGRYVVRLPLKSKDPKVTGSRETAEKRFKTLESKLNKNEDLKTKYTEVINEYISLNHMELVPNKEIENSRAVYLPHHAVVREDKSTSKVRVVFDASCEGKNHMSLNDYFQVGPTLQVELRHIMLRWRAAPICLSADIVKMYRQVLVDKQDTDLQRILWKLESGETKHYRLLRLTFGTACAPYLAVKALQQVALDDGAGYPMAAERIINDFYMDDLLTGCQSKEEGIEVYREVNELLSKGGFQIQKWTTNNDELLEEMKEKEINKEGLEELKIKADDLTKVVGLTWNRKEDTFHYSVSLSELERPITKRKIISDVSRFYDPLGWAGPSTIISKIMIQKLWLAGIDWNEEVPNHLLNEWLAYREELVVLSELRIPRWLGTKVDDILTELHGFSDASQVAYAAVVYIRVISSDGRIRVAMVSSKTKVAPVKQVSIPRLELCGAVLLAKLLKESSKVLNIDKAYLHAWTDSTVVLAWLNGHPQRWKVFVANRVSEILGTLDSHHWAHVCSKQNPADCASRGLNPSSLVKNELWIQGPEFLKQKNIDYVKPKTSTDLEKIITKSHCTTTKLSIFERFSSLTHMVRVLSYCRRLVTKQTGYLTTEELRDTLNGIIRQCQADNFSKEIHDIMKNKNLPANSKLRPLNPVADEVNILRLGGRLENAQWTHNQRHPIILPKQSHLTQLVIADATLKRCMEAHS